MALAALAIVGCSEEEDRPGRGLPPGTTGSLSTSASSGAGGDGGGGGGVGGGPGGGGGVGGMEPPVGEPICSGDVGFWASGLSAVAQTPKDLALVLNGLTYDITTHPITILLLAAKGADKAQIAAAATDTTPTGEAFPDAQTPGLVPATLAPGKFSMGAPQATGWVKVVDDNGPVAIELINLTLSAQTASNCTTAFVTLEAIIPISQGSTSLTVDGTTATIAELAGPGPSEGWPYRSIFLAETTSFDLASFP